MGRGRRGVVGGAQAAKLTALFNHLVGDGEQRWRHLDAERACRLKVDDKLELGRRLHRQVGRLGALEDAIDIVRAPGDRDQLFWNGGWTWIPRWRLRRGEWRGIAGSGRRRQRPGWRFKPDCDAAAGLSKRADRGSTLHLESRLFIWGFRGAEAPDQLDRIKGLA
jgi:hypothetical protein